MFFLALPGPPMAGVSAALRPSLNCRPSTAEPATGRMSEPGVFATLTAWKAGFVAVD
jgi:hypothetical protein